MKTLKLRSLKFDPTFNKAPEGVPLKLLAISLVLHLLLSLSKFLVGYWSASLALQSDAANNLSDVATLLITISSFLYSRKPADKQHPYGHARFEYLASILMGTFIFLLGFELLKSSVTLLIYGGKTPILSPLFCAFLVLSLAIKFVLYLYFNQASKKSKSLLMQAQSKDYLGDVGLGLALLLSALVQRFFGLVLDAYLALMVSLFIFKMAIEILMASARKVIGSKPSKALLQEIKQLAEVSPFVLSTHDLILHDYGLSHRFGTLDVCVPSSLSLMEAHRLAHQIEDRVEEALGIRLVVHIDPVLITNRQQVHYQKLLSQIVDDLAPQLQLHDVQLHGPLANRDEQGAEAISQVERISFDLTLPDAYDEDSDVLCQLIRQRFAEQEKDIALEIYLERGYLQWRSRSSSAEHRQVK